MSSSWLPVSTIRPLSSTISLSSAAIVGFLLATQRGLLAVSAVLASLYPAATVVLASVVLREPVHRPQALGLGLCAVTVVCVALG